MKTTKRFIAMILSIITVMSTLVGAAPMTVNAADGNVTTTPTGWDEGRAANLWNGGTISGNDNFFILHLAGTMVYCLEPGQPLNNGEGVNINSYVNTLHTPSIKENGTVATVLGRLYQYADYSASGSPLNTDAGKAQYIALRVLTWEVTQGERDANFNYVAPPSGYDRVRQIVDNSTLSTTNKNLIISYYNSFVSKVQNHHRVPSFTNKSQSSATTHEMTEKDNVLSVTMTDGNSVLSGYDFSANGDNLTFKKDGNKLIVTAKKGFEGEVLVTGKSNNINKKGLICYGDGGGGRQDTVAVGSTIADPINAYFKIKAAYGHLSIIKTTKNNDGQVGGFQFEVKQGNNNIGTFKSADDGRILIENLKAGTYTVTEVNLSDEFVKPTPNPVTVEVKSGQTAKVSFDNVKKMGIITVQKSNSNKAMGDYSLEGAEFSVKDKNGKLVDTIKTAKDGKGQSKALPLGTYTVQETKAPWGFVVDKGVYTRTLTGSLGTAEIVYSPELGIAEKPQLGQVKITKSDTETATNAQGDATLSGAVFDLLDKDGKQVERLYCGDKNVVVSKHVPLGNYTVKEVVPPKGYTLSQKEYPVKIDYAGQDVEVNLISSEVSNMVIKGKIQLVKHSDDPDPNVDPENPQVQKPLDGVVFEVYLKSAGSYQKAKETERDLLTTDENGYAVTKNLPYGMYVVKEIKGAAEHKICEPFDVFINQNDRTYFYIVENPVYQGKVKIVKVDETTGKVIPQANIEFKVKNADTGEWIAQEILYPTPVTIDTYLTNAEGYLVMPKELRFGNYELWEVQSPYGYLLSDKPIPFKVTSEDPQEFLEVKMPNKPVMGKVTVEKTGEVLTGASENEGKNGTIYLPEYEVRGIAGATFNIVAANDIVTPDGTIRAKKGDVVDTITTKKNGKAESKELFLGDYYAIETVVPVGYLIDETPLPFSLVYVDQHTALVSAETGQFNERAKGEINLLKTAEEVKLSEDGEITYVQVPAKDIVFGLYARNDIKNVDGKVVIAADSLMDIVITDESGKAVSTRDIPFGAYYVKELRTRNNLVASDKEYDVVFSYKDAHTPLVTVAANEGKAIENFLIKGKLKVIKTNEVGEPLAGVEFTVIGADTGITVKLVTDENGVAETGVLPYDCYSIVETKTQDSYALDEHEHTLLLAKDGETYEFGIVNFKIRGQIKVIKTDGKTKTPLEGVVFEVKDADGKVIAEIVTDAEGIALTDELLYGKYTVTEKSTGEAYVLDETAHEIFIKEHKKVVELQLENHKKVGQIKVIKTDGKTKTPLEGVVFEVFDLDGKVVATLTTGKDGTATTDPLSYGIYTVKEKTAKEGYVLDETAHEIEIKEHEKVYELELTNNKIPEEPKTPDTPKTPDNPKTGDESNMSLWIALVGISLIGLIGIKFWGRYKRENKNAKED